MATIIPVGFANARFIFQCNGIVDEMGFSIGFDVGLGQDATSIAIDAESAFATTVWGNGANASDQYTFVGVSVTEMGVSGPFLGQQFTNTPGTLTNAVPPSNLSLLVNKQTALGGRKNRGRIFMPTAIVFEVEVDQAGDLTSGTVAGQQTNWAAFFAALGTATLTPYLLHSNPADAPTEITGFLVQSKMATQRRRMR